MCAEIMKNRDVLVLTRLYNDVAAAREQADTISVPSEGQGRSRR